MRVLGESVLVDSKEYLGTYQGNETVSNECAENESYDECGKNCLLTCRFVAMPLKIVVTEEDCSKSECVKGCFCKDGFVRLLNKCVPVEECPTRKGKALDDSESVQGPLMRQLFRPCNLFGGCTHNQPQYIQVPVSQGCSYGDCKPQSQPQPQPQIIHVPIHVPIPSGCGPSGCHDGGHSGHGGYDGYSGHNGHNGHNGHSGHGGYDDHNGHNGHSDHNGHSGYGNVVHLPASNGCGPHGCHGGYDQAPIVHIHNHNNGKNLHHIYCGRSQLNFDNILHN